MIHVTLMWNADIPEDQYQKIPTEEWDIRDTIFQLAYLTHNYLRYYGKYIPPIATNLIERYTERQDIILDNFAGCGTGLVEAQLHGRNSVGVEINPLGVLASKVKTTIKYDYNNEVVGTDYEILKVIEVLKPDTSSQIEL